MKEIPIVFEDDEIFVVDKPAGMSVQGGAGVAHPLDEALAAQTGRTVHLVHRLDRDTRGLLVVAKTARAAAKWTALLSSGAVKKEYAALCFGVPAPGGTPAQRGTLRAPVRKGARDLPAVTHFTVEKTWAATIPPGGTAGNASAGALQSYATGTTESAGHAPAQSLTLSKIRLTLGTGRMHQIRIHLAGAGAPIAGDDKHGDFKLNKLARRIGIKVLQLCAVRLTIPLGGKPRTFALPDPFTDWEQ